MMLPGSPNTIPVTECRYVGLGPQQNEPLIFKVVVAGEVRVIVSDEAKGGEPIADIYEDFATLRGYVLCLG